ncbi:Protein EFR3 B [Cocos nucifera]|nr:Protein EFR3 B [Cocos nucifera]
MRKGGGRRKEKDKDGEGRRGERKIEPPEAHRGRYRTGGLLGQGQIPHSWVPSKLGTRPSNYQRKNGGLEVEPGQMTTSQRRVPPCSFLMRLPKKEERQKEKQKEDQGNTYTKVGEDREKEELSKQKLNDLIVLENSSKDVEGSLETSKARHNLQSSWSSGEGLFESCSSPKVVTIVLENYGGPPKKSEGHQSSKDSQSRWVQEVLKAEGHVAPSPFVMSRVPSWRSIVNEKGELRLTKDDSQNPNFWSRVCVHNMAKLAKEATTVRRVLESFFRYFDGNNSWSSQNGLALGVLMDMQLLMEKAGQNTHLLISILIKHLEHKAVLKQPDLQLNIVEVTASLAEQSKAQASVSIIGAISDLVRHLRKTMHCTLGSQELGNDIIRWNNKFQTAVDECIVQLSKKLCFLDMRESLVGDAGPVLDMMAVMLENISTSIQVARSTVSAVYRTAQIIASIPNLSYQNKAFPEALFHQLLLAMVHPDHETRVGAHRIFSVVLVPSSVCPYASSATPESLKAYDLRRTLSRTVSVFSSSAALFEKLREKYSLRDNGFQESLDKNSHAYGGQQKSSNEVNLYTLQSSKSRNHSVKGPRLQSFRSRVFSTKGSPLPVAEEKSSTNNAKKEVEPVSLRLSSRQITLMLSSIWAQVNSPENTPENYEAIAHSYSLILLFSRAKVDPFLQLVQDSKLQAVNTASDHLVKVYGSKEDDNSALISLSAVELTENQSKESMVSVILNSLGDSSDTELPTIRKQLLSDFLPDDVCPLGAQFVETPGQVPPFGSKKDNSQEEVMPPTSLIDVDVFAEAFEGLVDPSPQLPSDASNLLSVNQLLDTLAFLQFVLAESLQISLLFHYSEHKVLETSWQDGRFSVSTTPDVPFKEMASHCEALLMGKQQKMSAFMSAQQKQEILFPDLLHDQHDMKGSSYLYMDQFQKTSNPFLDPSLSAYPQNMSGGNNILLQNDFQYHPQFLRLPATSPFDNFLRAAGC